MLQEIGAAVAAAAALARKQANNSQCAASNSCTGRTIKSNSHQ
jgi:hypothetical protein